MPAGDRKLTYEELGRISPGHYKDSPRLSLYLILEDVRSRHNVGSIFRTADAFGVAGLILCGFTPTPPHREIEKTALGATGSVPWSHRSDALQAVLDLKAQGVRVLAVEQTRMARSLETLAPVTDQPLALVFGNELQGVTTAVVEACDACILVPQWGSKHSLNVAVCAGIVLWHLAGPPR